MGFESFGQQDRDPGRKRRLAIGAGLGVLLLGGFLAAGTALGAIGPPKAEEEVDVKLVAKMPEPPPPPPPPAPPPPPVQKAAPPPVAAKATPLTPPTAMPTEKPPEVDPSQAKAEIPVGEGRPDGDPHGTGKGTGKAVASAAPAPPPPPPQAPAGAMQLPENADPPVAVTKPMPAYPEAARGQGVEAVVVVKFIVTETGEVIDVTVLRGHPLFDAAVLETVKTWRFQPAVLEGRPIRVYRVVKIPFKLRT